MIANNSHTFYKLTDTHIYYAWTISNSTLAEENLNNLNLPEQFSKDINMKFGIDKCKINSVISGRNYKHQITLDSGEFIKSLEELDTYKSLGYE